MRWLGTNGQQCIFNFLLALDSKNLQLRACVQMATPVSIHAFLLHGFKYPWCLLYSKTGSLDPIMFFTRLTSWESACKIIAQRGNISPLYPFPPPELSHSFSRHYPRSGIKRAKNMEFSPLCWENNALSSETFAFFETTISFSGTHNISVHALAPKSSGELGNVVKIWMFTAIPGRC